LTHGLHGRVKGQDELSVQYYVTEFKIILHKENVCALEDILKVY